MITIIRVLDVLYDKCFDLHALMTCKGLSFFFTENIKNTIEMSFIQVYLKIFSVTSMEKVNKKGDIVSLLSQT